MSRHLPSLNGLRAFEAAARHLSFTRAAGELNVTQAAVSHQVKTLEERLGLPLFRRKNRQLILTEAGQTLLPAMTDALDGMEAAIGRIQRDDESGILTVATMDSIAATWLMPRLRDFRSRHAEIDVRLATSDELEDYDRMRIDVGIRLGPGNWDGLQATRLMNEEVFPVCSPALLQQGIPLETPSDLRHFTLIHDDMLIDWRVWLECAGVGDIDPTRGPGYQHSNLVVQAAINGDGVALGRSVLVSDALEKGLLVRPFALALPATWPYYIVATPASFDRPKVRAFREWLLAQAEDTPGCIKKPSEAPV